ncbi:FtsX-like permease family protein [Neokomagataea anthophila]|nr:FtsX-like permease family protein [Neokomagataea anthophila]
MFTVMFTGIFKGVYRTLTYQKRYAAINIAGLALGVAVFLVMALTVRYQLSYNGSYPGMSDVYRADEAFRLPGNAPFETKLTSFVGAPFLKQDFPDIKDVVRVWDGRDMTLRLSGNVQREAGVIADPNFFSFFKVGVIAGDRAHALDRAESVAIPASIARKYFGTEQALGRVLTDVNTKTSFTVTLVYADPPPNTDVTFGVVRRATKLTGHSEMTQWGVIAGEIYVRIPDKRALAGIQAGLDNYPLKHRGEVTEEMIRTEFGKSAPKLVPFGALHFYDATIGEGGEDQRLVYILAFIGLAALAISGVNYINLATARAGERAREVAMRKVLGATRGALIQQFIAEAVGIALIAGLFGLAIAEVSLRFVNAQGGWKIAFDLWFAVPVGLGIAALAGLLAGVYPAFILSGYRAASVLASSKMPSGGKLAGRLRNGLVVAQFAFATGLAICALIMGQQAAYVQSLAQKANPDEIVVVHPPKIGGETALQQAFASVPGAVAVGRSNLWPHQFNYNRMYGRQGAVGKKLLNVGYVSPEYQALYAVKMLAGRWFDPARAMDFAGANKEGTEEGAARSGENIVINAQAARMLGFARPEDAVGKTIHESDDNVDLTISGVVADLRLNGPSEGVKGIVFFGLHTTHPQGGDMAWQVRIHGVTAGEARERVQAAWHRVRPDDVFNPVLVSDVEATEYRESGNLSRLFGVGAGVSILIACLGLFGLSVFTLARRAHEIGIRKVLGAAQKDIFMLLGREFLGPVILASVVAWPVSLLVMWRWLAGFNERVGLGLGPCLLVTAIALIIAGGTVLVQAVRASRQPPAVALQR